MENANSYEYLDKIKVAVIENLRMTAPVPSVQMQDVPRQTLGMSDDQEDEEDDRDEDENKDVRMSQRQWEKSVARQDEFEESDDEDMARANGVFKPNGRSRQETSFRNAGKDDDNMEIDSGIATPAEHAAEAAANNDDTMIDEAQAEAPEAEVEEAAATKQPAEGEKAKLDGDGDVDMSEPAATEEKPTEATIKKEEVEGMSATAAAEPANTPATGGDADMVGTGDNNAAAKQRASGSPEAGGTHAEPAERAPAAVSPPTDAVPAEKKADEDSAKA